MAQNRPITLKQVKEYLQDSLNKRDQVKTRQYIQILDRLGVRVKYSEVSEEEYNNGIKNRVKEILTSKGIPKLDSTNLIKSIPMNDSDQGDINLYANRLYGYYENKNRN